LRNKGAYATMTDLLKGLVVLLAALTGLMTSFDASATGVAGSELLAYSHKPSRIKQTQTVAVRDLPQPAQDTLALIRKGGPFPYPQDGTVFRNREGRLPGRPSGYYREYTVKTPEARDRGARRIIAGHGGEFYYTDDHYRTFKLVKE
jgi:ribonuclease T1